MVTESELRERLARNLRALADARGVPLVQLADDAGVSRTHFWDVLGCRKAATITFLAKLAAALRVDPSDLLEKEHRK